MSLNLTEVFEVVLKSAIEAQFNANEYSAELAEKQKAKAASMVGTGNRAEQGVAKPYYPIPNSNLQGVGIKLKVKFEEIETDIKRSQARIIRYIQGELDEHFPHLQQINAFAKPQRLSGALLKCKLGGSVNVHDLTVRFFSLYLYLFWKKLGGRDQSPAPDYKELALLEGAVFEETQRILNDEKEFPDADYREISFT